jgi:hypothetical protein
MSDGAEWRALEPGEPQKATAESRLPGETGRPAPQIGGSTRML